MGKEKSLKLMKANLDKEKRGKNDRWTVGVWRRVSPNMRLFHGVCGTAGQ